MWLIVDFVFVQTSFTNVDLRALMCVGVYVSEVVKPTSMKRIVLGLLNEYGCNDDDLAVDDLAPNVT